MKTRLVITACAPKKKPQFETLVLHSVTVYHLQNQMFPGSSKLIQCSSHPETQTVREKKLQVKNYKIVSVC